MSYLRIYPKKNNTLFKNNTGFKEGVVGLINTSKNPIMELRDGASQSILIFQFDIEPIKQKLNNFSYVCNLNLFDAGQVYEPAINLKKIDLIYFSEDFVEGDGYGFEQGDFKVQVSNFIYRDNDNEWLNVLKNNVSAQIYQLQTPNEDLKLNCTTYIEQALNDLVDRPNFGIKITNSIASVAKITVLSGNSSGVFKNISINNINILNEDVYYQTNNEDTVLLLIDKINQTQSKFFAELDTNEPNSFFIYSPLNNAEQYNGKSLSIITEGTISVLNSPFENGVNGIEVSNEFNVKFIYGKDTRTIFKPYLEFFINDEIIDQRKELVIGENVNLVLLNQRNFPGTVTCSITNSNDVVLITPSVKNPLIGRYEINFIVPNEEIIYENWYSDGDLFYRAQLFTISPLTYSPPIINKQDYYFFCSNRLKTIKQGDVVYFTVNAEIRFDRKIYEKGFEYLIMTSSGFVMIPWTKVNLYQNNMFFYVDTSFFYPDIEYLIYLRYNNGEIIETSDIINKFKVETNGLNRLDNFNASPYNSRDYFIRKQ